MYEFKDLVLSFLIGGGVGLVAGLILAFRYLKKRAKEDAYFRIGRSVVENLHNRLP